MFYVFLTGHSSVTFGSWALDLGWLYVPFGILLITGTSNAVNLTDGLDGLAGTNIAIALVAFTSMLFVQGNIDVAIVTAAVLGATIGFLYFNHYPAKVFMGDTGSLAIGGLLGTLAVMGKFEFLLIFLAAIFVAETLSVIIQVTSYKTTGKRVFKMAPVHHHFELCGWSEKKIVIVFAIFSFVCSLFAYGLHQLFIKGIL